MKGKNSLKSKIITSLKKHKYIVLLIIVCLTGFLIRFLSVRNMELLSDEYFDIPIALAIKNSPNPFEYYSDFKSYQIEQMRFPFYLSAFFFYFLKSETISDLAFISRLISIIFSVLTIIVIYFFGKELKDEKAGILAATLLSISVYYIAFSRYAMTTGDSIFVFFYTLASFLFFKAINSNSEKLLFVSSIVTGIAIASKLFGIFLILTYSYFIVKNKVCSSSKLVTVFGICILFLFAFNILINIRFITEKLNLYFISAVLSVIYAIMLFKTRGILNFYYRILNMSILIVIFTFIFSPTHLSTFAISKTFNWFSTWNSSELANSAIYDYVKILYIRLHFPANLLFLFGLASLAFRHNDKRACFLFLSFIVPFAALSLLKWKLTWHMMFLLPIIYLIVVDSVFLIQKFFEKRAGNIVLWIFVILLIFSETKVLLELHPYYELDGYQYGEKNIGYNKASFLSVQKMPQAVDFLVSNVPENSSIGYFFMDYYASNVKTFQFLKSYAPKKRYEFILLTKDNINQENYDYALVHFRARDFMKKVDKCTLFNTISHKTIDIYHIYRCKKEIKNLS